MKKIKAAVVGYGNIGRYVLEALDAAPDFEVAGVVRRDASNVPDELRGYRVVDSVEKLEGVDVAVLCTPSRSVEEQAGKILALGINTVDSFDIHTDIAGLRSRLTPVAKEHGAVAVISAGWDPGSDSVVRALLEACAPKGLTYTNFGPGMSMGHTVAVKAVDGVKAALSMTIPTGTGIHRRMVYVELKEGYDFSKVAQAIKSDDYFVHDETHVMQVECVDRGRPSRHGTRREPDPQRGFGQDAEPTFRVQHVDQQSCADRADSRFCGPGVTGAAARRLYDDRNSADRLPVRRT